MQKAGKTLENRNQVKFYVREEYKQDFMEFNVIIEKDPHLQALRYNKKLGLMSIAIMELVRRYVRKYKELIKEETHEEPTETQDNEKS